MAVPSTMAYRKMLMDIGNLLSERDLKNTKYFCRDVIPRGRLEAIEQPMELWDALEERAHISEGNTEFLKAMLHSGTEGRTDLQLIIRNYEVWQRPRGELPCVNGLPAVPAYHVQRDSLQNHHFTGPTYNELKREMDFLVKSIGRDWRRLLRELGVSEADMDYLCEAHPRDLRETVRQGLLLWQTQCQGRASKDLLIQALGLCSRNDLVHSLSSGSY